MSTVTVRLAAREDLVEALWKPVDCRGRRKSPDRFPKQAADAILILETIVRPGVESGRHRHSVPLKATAKRLGLTQRRVQVALACLLRLGILRLAAEQLGVRRQYEVGADFILSDSTRPGAR